MRKKLLGLFAVLVVFAASSRCGGAPTEPRDFEFGRIDVYVKDTTGAAINGVPVRLDNRNGTTEDAGGTTGSVGLPGYYFFLRTSGRFRIVITVPSDYELAPGQTAAVDVEFERNAVRTVNIALRHL
jgi:hypothetical protein